MRTQLVPALILCGLTVACGPKPGPEPESPPAPVATSETPPPAPPAQKPGDDPSQSTVSISDVIKAACGLTETDAHFSYNSANVRSQDQIIMNKLAECFTTGKLKGRTMSLVGHADPRGEPEYNMTLGGQRADNVAGSLKAAGLPAAQVTTTSRGELDAIGTDAASWLKDRRVDILLADQ